MGISQLQKKLGGPKHSPKEIFYAATSETCCGEDPHAVHGIETPDGGFVLTGKSLEFNFAGHILDDPSGQNATIYLETVLPVQFLAEASSNRCSLYWLSPPSSQDLSKAEPTIAISALP